MLQRSAHIKYRAWFRWPLLGIFCQANLVVSVNLIMRNWSLTAESILGYFYVAH